MKKNLFEFKKANVHLYGEINSEYLGTEREIEASYSLIARDSKDKNSSRIAKVIGAFGCDYYSNAIENFLNEGGTGYQVAGISHNIKKREDVIFYFDFENPGELTNYSSLPYNDTIELFYLYFNGFKGFIEEYLPKYKETDWYKRFLTSLGKLNKKWGESDKANYE